MIVIAVGQHPLIVDTVRFHTVLFGLDHDFDILGDARVRALHGRLVMKLPGMSGRVGRYAGVCMAA